MYISDSKYKITNEEHWTGLLFLVLIALLIVLVLLQRKAPCLESKFVETVELLQGGVKTTLHRCGSVKAGLPTMDPASIQRWADKFNRMAKLAEPVVISQFQVALPNSLQLKAQLDDDSLFSDAVIYGKWIAQGLSGAEAMLAEAALTISFRGTKEFESVMWPFDRSLKRIVQAAIFDSVSLPELLSKGNEAWATIRSTVLEMESEIVRIGDDAAGMQSLKDTQFQQNLRDHKRMQNTLEKLESRTKTTALVRERFISALKKRGLGREALDLKFDFLFWSEGMSSDEIAQLRDLMKNQNLSIGILSSDQTILQTSRGDVPVSLLGRVTSAEAIRVHCETITPQLIASTGKSARRILFVQRCDSLESTLRWQALVRSGIDGFASANMEVPFIQLDAWGALRDPEVGEERLKKSGFFLAKEKYFRVIENKDVILAYRNRKATED